MKLVSENSEVEIAANRAAEAAQLAVAELAANLMRIARGAGAPEDIREQVVRLAAAIEDHRAAARGAPTEAMVAALRLPADSDQASPSSEAAAARAFARQSIVKGALQYAAATILDQRAQAAAGEREIADGVRELADLTRPLRAASRKSTSRTGGKRKSGGSPKRPSV